MEIGITQWEFHGNETKNYTWEWKWEGMGIDCMGIGM